jgi:hypothetical protein
VATPGPRELVGALLRAQVLVAKHAGDRLPRPSLLPREPGRLVLRVVLQEREERADAQVGIGQLGHLRDAEGEQDGVVGEPLGERGEPRVHGEDGGLEAELPLHVERVREGEARGVAGDHLVRDEVHELGDGDLERGVELVGRLVARRAVRVPGAAEVVHRARERRVLDGQELDVRPRDGVERGGEVRHHVAAGALLEPGDERLGEELQRPARHEPLAPPRVDGREEPLRLVGDPEQLRELRALRPRL